MFSTSALTDTQRFFVVPIVNSTLIVVGSIYAAVFFQEVYRWDISSSLLVPLGILITSFGIGLLSMEPDEDVEDHVVESAQDTCDLEYELNNDVYIRL
mmetsp:Transcript_23578/g.51258  ORF Transcript_23578/g.51258 Transcript_23578/m.51258 type:complete len:98 (+) Transcript_23578:918-1211(+)